VRFWVPEIRRKPGAFAMVHSKIVVIDPIGEHPVVITGSHNLGPKASAKNDDNMIIIENDCRLAQEYSVNIMTIYNQYRWRWRRSQFKASAKLRGLDRDDSWQKGYFQGEKAREINFWLGAAAQARMAVGRG
jgi:phosphatidylserine/phosphatidylglycerophosphate/cardiolipin synthase-like enzyme